MKLSKQAKLIFLLLTMVTFSLTQEAENCLPGKCHKCTYLGESFSCDECYFSSRILAPKEEGQELDHFKCSETNDIAIENCISLEIDPQTGVSDKDTCNTCQPGYFLSLAGSKCEKFQIQNCIAGTLTDEGLQQCMICIPQYAVYGNECKKIDSDDKIDNCRSYLTIDIPNANTEAFLKKNKFYSKIDVSNLKAEQIFCATCSEGYYETSNSKECTRDKEKTKCQEGEQAQGETTTCVECSLARDYWSTGVSNRFNDAQVCVFQKTDLTKDVHTDLDVPVMVWIISLAIICIGVCFVQCDIFGSRKHLFAENKKRIRRNFDEEKQVLASN